MASPIHYYVCPDCGINIDIANKEEQLKKELKPTDLRTPRKYTICKESLREIVLDYDVATKPLSKGNLSPLSPITLPSYYKDHAGIPHDARYYAYIHPPPDLSDLFDYESILQALNGVDMLKDPEFEKRRLIKEKSKCINMRGHSQIEEAASPPTPTPFPTPQEYRRIATSTFAVFGGFAYFDENFKLLRVNALSLKRTDFKLFLSGPYQTTDEASKAVVYLDRSNYILIKLVQEAGFVSKSFVRPGEMFKGKFAVSEKLSSHGAFVYHKDNGTSVTYVVVGSTTQALDDKETHSFQSLADIHFSIPLVGKLGLSKVFVRHDDFDECDERVQRFVQQKKKPDDIDGFPLLHQALKVQRPLDEIKSIVETYGFKDEKDKFGWSALHYACRFQADNSGLIAWLLSEGALNIADHHGRYPLHIACDSSPSHEVMILLLYCNGDNLVSQPTSILERLPLHIACDAIASTAVIEELLRADGISTKNGRGRNYVVDYTDLPSFEYDKMMDGGNRRLSELIDRWKKAKSSSDEDNAVEVTNSSLSKPTLIGRTALHLAIDKRLPNDTIELLLGGDSTILVRQWFRGMLPLHMAILNHYGEDIIKLLMDKDKDGSALKKSLKYDKKDAQYNYLSPLCSRQSTGGTNIQTVDMCASFNEEENTPEVKKTIESDSDYKHSTYDERKPLTAVTSANVSNDQATIAEADRRPDSQRSLTRYTKHLHGMRALHLCFSTRSFGAARLLLQREMRFEKKDREYYTSVVDNQTGRTALHMACAINCEVDIIKLLCEADPNRKAITAADITGSIPLHLACGHKDARCEVVKELLDADQDRIKTDEDSKSNCGLFLPESSAEMQDNHSRNPLARAIQENAPDTVLEVLLESRNINVDCLDDKLIASLAGKIKKSGTLQTAIIEIMAQRIPFALLFLELAVNLLAIIVFFIHTEEIFLGEKGHLWTDNVLLFCAIFFFLREMVQMASEKIGYIFHAHNLFEIINLVFLFSSIVRSRVDYNLRSAYPWDQITKNTIPSDYDNNHTWAILGNALSMRVLLMVTAILLIVNFIVSLRSAFLPFARFVGGLQIIFYTLFPFFIVTAAILIAFSATYRFEFKIDKETDAILEINEEDVPEDSLRHQCIYSFALCLTKTLQAFFSGGDVDNWLDIVFGIVAIIILLNVVIAIVSDAWEDARDHATDIYWRGRIAFLSESSVVIRAHQKFRSLRSIYSKAEQLFKHVDDSNRISLEEPKFSWSKDHPYCLVKSKACYDNPDRFLQKSDANVIKNARSLKSDLRWLNDSLRRRKESGQIPTLMESWWLLIARLWFKWFLFTGWYAGCLVIGLPFLGILWPLRFRKYILSYGNMLEDPNGENEIKQVTRDEVKKLLESTIEEFIKVDTRKQAQKDRTTDNTGKGGASFK